MQPLLKIFNLSLSTGIVPNELKIAKVIPIFKTGNLQSFGNYRPISLLPCFSKVLERLVANRLNKFIDKHKILDTSQYGFRANYSTQMALIDLVDKITASLDKTNHTYGIFLDLSKAFDTTDHDILLNKMSKYGIRGTVFDWFKNYLFDRKQFVVWQNSFSSLKPVSCGVPQGSILGPILFLLYINDLPNSTNLLKFILFADDTNLFYSSKDQKEATSVINRELRSVSEWMNCNKLSVNLKKTCYMIFSNKDVVSSNIVFNNALINQVTKTTFLGVIIDNKLSWRHHCQKIHMSISRTLGILRRVRNMLPREALFSIYNALILPQLQYGILAWGNSSQLNLNKLLVVQKKSLRVINRSDYRAHALPLFVKYNTLPLHDLYQYELGVLRIT